MNNRVFLFSALLCIATHIVRAIYEILKHKKIVKPGRTSFAIIFLNMSLLWASWFSLCSSDISAVKLPAALHYLGITLLVAGVIIFLTALLTIKTLETYEGNLITKGIYSRIRHPMYLGFLFWLIGAPLFFGGVYSFMLSILFIVNVLFWRYLEEIELVNRFPDYVSYRKRTFF